MIEVDTIQSVEMPKIVKMQELFPIFSGVQILDDIPQDDEVMLRIRYPEL